MIKWGMYIQLPGGSPYAHMGGIGTIPSDLKLDSGFVLSMNPAGFVRLGGKIELSAVNWSLDNR
jgi:hypothetical protein